MSLLTELEKDIVRFTDAIGLMNPKSSSRYDTLGETVFPDWLGGCRIGDLPAIMADPYTQELVSVKCNHCETMIECRRIVSPFVACDSCIERIQHDEKINMYAGYWKQVCPANYRETNIHREGFPLAIWKEVQQLDKATPGQSFFLYGPTEAGKTRVAFLLLKQALLRGERVGVLWPEKISTLKTHFKTDVFDHYASYDRLLLDDTLLTACRESEMVDLVKMLVDVRMREKRPMILTSQIGEEGVQDGKQYGEVKSTDLERIAALMRRLRETCTVVPFVKAVPAPGEMPF